MLEGAVLDQIRRTTGVATEPILVNMNQYAVLIRTPEGRYINVPGNSRVAVVGPGFETYIERRVLMMVGADFKGPVLYATPLSVVNPPVVFREPVGHPEEKMVTPVTEEEALAFGVARASSQAAPVPASPPPPAPVEEVIEFGPPTADGSPLPMAEIPAPAPSSPPKPETKAQVQAPVAQPKKIPTGAPLLPPRYKLQGMKHKELAEVANRLGIKSDGTRGQILGRLLPLAKD